MGYAERKASDEKLIDVMSWASENLEGGVCQFADQIIGGMEDLCKMAQYGLDLRTEVYEAIREFHPIDAATDGSIRTTLMVLSSRAKDD